jgi:hypothetical protein
MQVSLRESSTHSAKFMKNNTIQSDYLHKNDFFIKNKTFQ